MSIAVFLINLERDADRLAYMAQAIGDAGLAFTRVKAVYGLDMPDWVKPYFLNADGTIASGLRRGEVGCYASHLVVAREMIEQNLPYALVFEDDLEFPANFVPLIEAALAHLPLEWDIVRLSNPPKAAYFPYAALPDSYELALYARVPNNTGASLLSLSGAKKLLRPGMRMLQIDEHLRRPWDLGLETFGIIPAPIRSNIFDVSTIDAMDTRGLGHESWLKKLGRRHWPRPVMLWRQLSWQLRHLGVSGLVRSIVRTWNVSLKRRLFGKAKATHQHFRLAHLAHRIKQ